MTIDHDALTKQLLGLLTEQSEESRSRDELARTSLQSVLEVLDEQEFPMPSLIEVDPWRLRFTFPEYKAVLVIDLAEPSKPPTLIQIE